MIAHLVRQIVSRSGVLSSIVTADWDDEDGLGEGFWVDGTDVTHRIAGDASDEVLNCEIACKAPYPFTDDGDGNAVSVT